MLLFFSLCTVPAFAFGAIKLIEAHERKCYKRRLQLIRKRARRKLP